MEVKVQHPVVGRLIIANPGEKFYSGLFFVCSKAFSGVIFSALLRKCNHQIVDKKNNTEFDL